MLKVHYISEEDQSLNMDRCTASKVSLSLSGSGTWCGAASSLQNCKGTCQGDGTDLQRHCACEGFLFQAFSSSCLQRKHTKTQQGMVRKLDVFNTKSLLPYVLSSTAITNKCLIKLLSKELLPRKISSIWLHQCIF